MLIDRENWIKGMKVGKLKELLSQIDDSCVLIPNLVRNLTIENEEGEMIGHIDFLDDSIEFWPDEEVEHENNQN